ncbi:MAG: phosphopentomutase [Clostridia bacterium]|nr:phosphopentomutase [Clostridia bacterium]
MSKRVFLIVLDSVGAGEAPDAAAFGDVGAHTLRSVYETGRLHLPNLNKLGLGHVDGLSFLGKTASPMATVARLRERAAGKDTTAGHWELAGYAIPHPLPTFPNGFPTELIRRFSEKTGYGVLCNLPYSGTDALRDFGEEHLQTGKLIVYTSSDSVFQIAAHTSLVSEAELYEICRQARELLQGAEWGVGRVIARPFEGSAPDFHRTAGRKDFSLTPPSGLLPQTVKEHGMQSIAIGKIFDIFAGVGFTEHTPTHSNRDGMALTRAWMERPFCGLCFTNLVDFDMQWGHRRDALGYAEGLNELDVWLGEILPLLTCEDALMITADHGCDPAFTATTDHTREYVPLLLYRPGAESLNLGTVDGFSLVGETVKDLLGIGSKTR